ncbi:uncharacterized protein LOC144021944 isoform X2 [Festucalex cinctus]
MAENTDVSERYLCPEAEFPGLREEEDLEPLQVKEEEQPQPPNIKKEVNLPPCIKEEEDFTELPVTGVHLKTELEGQDEEKKWVKPPSSRSIQQIKTESDEDHRGGSQADSPLALTSYGDDSSSHTPHTDGDEQSEGDLACHTDGKRWKSQCGETFGYKANLRTHVIGHTGEKKPFACSICGQCFSQMGNLNQHKRTHTGVAKFGP